MTPIRLEEATIQYRIAGRESVEPDLCADEASAQRAGPPVLFNGCGRRAATCFLS